MLQQLYMNYIHSSSLLHQLSELWKADCLCDAVITVDHVIVAKAHKLVLLAFSSKLVEQSKDGSQNISPILQVVLPANVNHQAVHMFLQYLYDGYIHITDEVVGDLMLIAKELDIKCLFKCCRDFYMKYIADHISNDLQKYSDDLIYFEESHVRTNLVQNVSLSEIPEKEREVTSRKSEVSRAKRPCEDDQSKSSKVSKTDSGNHNDDTSPKQDDHDSNFDDFGDSQTYDDFDDAESSSSPHFPDNGQPSIDDTSQNDCKDFIVTGSADQNDCKDFIVTGAVGQEASSESQTSHNEESQKQRCEENAFEVINIKTEEGSDEEVMITSVTEAAYGDETGQSASQNYSLPHHRTHDRVNYSAGSSQNPPEEWTPMFDTSAVSYPGDNTYDQGDTTLDQGTFVDDSGGGNSSGMWNNGEQSTQQQPVKVSFSTGDIKEMKKVYPCHICGAVYKRKQHRSRHMQRHAQISYSCQKCGRMFTRNDHRKEHEMKCNAALSQ